jgi:putative MATE family efflux protein
VSDTPPGLWASLKEALHGSRQDFTEGPLSRAILLLAVPMVLEMVMESVFAVVDVFVVSRLGADAVATVGLTESVGTVLYAVAIGLGIGAVAVVSRRIGEKDPARASRAAAQALILGVLAAIPFAVSGVIFARPLLALMGASPWVQEHGTGYARVLLGSAPTIMLLFLANAVFRAAGDAAIAMRVLWLSNSLNLILAPSLVFGWGPFPRLGVTGAAVGTAIGRGCGVLYQLWALFRGRGRIAVSRADLRWDGGTLVAMVKLSASGMFQTLIAMASWIFLVRIVSTFGSAAVGGYTIAIRIVLFALLPSLGLGNAAATLMGQNLGARKPDRARKAVWLAGHYNLAFLGAVGLGFEILAGPLAAFFTREPDVARHAEQCLRAVASGFLFYAYGMVLTQAFNGAGDTRTPTWINLLCFWIVEIPLAWILSKPVGMGPLGAFISVAVAYSLLAAVSALLFRRGRWALERV